MHTYILFFAPKSSRESYNRLERSCFRSYPGIVRWANIIVLGSFRHLARHEICIDGIVSTLKVLSDTHNALGDGLFEAGGGRSCFKERRIYLFD